jgi:hypothetical protein
MKAFSIFLLFLTIIPLATAQECNCQKELEFVTNYYEENLPGFMDNVNETTIKSYTSFKNKLFKQSKNYCDDEDLCFKTLLVYVEFFKDNHSSIYTNKSVSVDESKQEEVAQFLDSALFKKREIIEDIEISTNNSIQHIENTYQTRDAAYTVAIVKNENEFRDFVGVIIDSKTPLWQKGQVKFELKKVAKDTYDMFMYMRNHSLRYYKNVQLKNGILNDTWYNTTLAEKKSYNIDVAHRDLIFKELDAETNYMYIPTFSGNWYAKITEFYKKHDSIIQSKPYLIIDVRNNGGGSDACAAPLLDYMYTKPFQTDKIDVYATKENIRKSEAWYENMKKDTVNFSEEFLEGFSAEIETMKSVPNKTFIPRSTGQTVTLDSVLANPKKIVIIANRYCASSCESLLFWAMKSDKTIIVGENSGGYVGYGEITSVNTPNFNFELGCTMTRYHHQRSYEADGIPPKYYLSNDKDWIAQAVEIVKKK